MVFHSENKVLVYSIFNDQIYEVIVEKTATRITTLLFSKGGKGYFMSNVQCPIDTAPHTMDFDLRSNGYTERTS